MGTDTNRIRLVREAGELVEDGTGAVFCADEYTEPRECLFDCCVCQAPIEDWRFVTCLDGGEAAHWDCVEVVDA